MMCSECGSVERSRLLWLYLDKMIRPEHKVLHFAPEKGIYFALSKRLPIENYVVADIEPHRYKFTDRLVPIDMTELDGLPSREYDFIIHCHVLEHIPCNEAYTLWHLHRALKEDGRHVFCVPLAKGYYDCTYTDIGREERVRRFGQWDHVRLFGRSDLDRSLGKLIKLPFDYDVTRDFSKETLREIRFPEDAWKGLSVHTIINLGRYDMKLLPRQPV